MIIPWLKGFVDYRLAPLTWLIIVLNFFIYLIVWDSEQKEMDYFETSREIVLLGKLYQQYKDPLSYKKSLLKSSQYGELGNRAIRDPAFLQGYKKFQFQGDEIENKKILNQLSQYLSSNQDRWSTHLGLNNFSNRWTDWITYQFMHASWIHVFGNMVMLLIFGSALEAMIGSLLFVILYLISGVVGGYFFIILNGISVVPMVGASASLSGVIAFYVFYEVRRRVAFVYFISPFPGYYGKIYLPTLLLLPLIFLQDIAGFLNSQSSLVGGVAYVAHIGGALAGLVLALIAKKFKSSPQYRWLVHSH